MASLSRHAIALGLFLLITFAAGASAQAAGGTLGFAATSYAVDVSAGTVSIAVTRTGGATGAANVSYITLDGTATHPLDYVYAQSTLHWASGDDASKTITVQIPDPAGFSSGKTFAVHLWNATGATLGSAQNTTVTIDGGSSPPLVSSSSGTLGLTASSYIANASTGWVSIAVARNGGSTGAASVNYITLDGTAQHPLDYGYSQSSLTWANGDATSKTIKVQIADPVNIATGKTFTVHLWSASGALLGAAQNATVTINGSGSTSGSGSTTGGTTGGTGSGTVVRAGTATLSATTYSSTATAGFVTVGVQRTSGGTDAASVQYATAAGTATAGVNYATTQGSITWAAGDVSTKTIQVPIYHPTSASSSTTFNVSLSGSTGVSVGTPATATVTIAATPPTVVASPPPVTTSPTGCAQSSSSWVSQSVGSGIFDYVAYGNYVVQADNWGNLPNQVTWANSAGCWGMTDSRTTDTGGISSYPHVTRGWMESSALGNLSTAGTYDWTTKSGMGIQVSQLTKAKMQWSFTTPTTAGIRWMALQDIYFHKTNNPAPSEFPPFIDLMIDQALADQVLNNTTYFALVATNDHASTVTLGGNTYLVTVDDPGEASFHQAGGHNIHLFNLPTSFTSNNANATWGVKSATTDVAAIIQYFMQPNPLNDAGQPLLNSSGNPITSPIIASNLYLNAINAGWEIDDGTAFSTNGFCIAMQSEPDCN